MIRRTKRIKNFTIYVVVLALVRLLCWLPHRVALGLGRALGLVAWVVAARERRRALANLAASSLGRGPRQDRRLVRQMFSHMGQSALECVVMGKRLRCRLGSPTSPVSYSPGALQALRQGLEQGRGVLFVTAHLGNWELMAAEVARQAPVTVLVKPSYDPRLTRVISDFRSDNGVVGISVKCPGHLRSVLATLARGHVVGVLLDQSVPNGCRTPFLGRPASTTRLVARLHLSTGAAIVAGFIHRVGLRHIVSISPISCGIHVTADMLTGVLSRAVEEAIREHPQQWMWSLDRWRSTERDLLSSSFANSIPVSNN